MNIDEDVILDLYPLYASGEASEATVKLVEAYLRDHPELDLAEHAIAEKLATLAFNSDRPEKEKETFMKVKKVLRRRSILLGVALFCSLMPFSMAGDSENGVTWLMIRDFPALAIVFGVTAVFVWLAYLWTFQTVADR